MQFEPGRSKVHWKGMTIDFFDCRAFLKRALLPGRLVEKMQRLVRSLSSSMLS